MCRDKDMTLTMRNDLKEGWRPVLLLVACVVSILCSAIDVAAAAMDYIDVSAEDLIANPKSYWSLAVVFEDTILSHPDGSRIEIGTQEFREFKTETIGTCYVRADRADVIADAKLNSKYILSGTVLNRPGGWLFNRAGSFCVVVQNITEILPGEEDIDDEFSQLLKAMDNGADIDDIDTDFERLLLVVQRELFAYSEEQDIEIADLFSSGFTGDLDVGSLINSAVVRFGRENKGVEKKMLGDVVSRLLLRHYGQAETEEIETDEIVEELVEPELVSESEPVLWGEEIPVGNEEEQPEDKASVDVDNEDGSTMLVEAMDESLPVEVETEKVAAEVAAPTPSLMIPLMLSITPVSSSETSDEKETIGVDIPDVLE